MKPDKKKLRNYKAGDELLYTGTLYTARDQAHKRLAEMIGKKQSLPFDLKDKIIYYCGPSETPAGRIIGSCGPTTAARMDRFARPLLKAGVLGMVGKGRRSLEVKKLIKKYRAVYFAAPAGCGALLSQAVLEKKIVCFSDLGPEAVYRLEVKDFPLIVAIDSQGSGIY